ncbi:MAG TPA: hypothetical protein VNQ56_05180, partial [Pseudolabrys sp.]|nr:hypothetical protein [Pseudolabrys sp.]
MNTHTEILVGKTGIVADLAARTAERHATGSKNHHPIRNTDCPMRVLLNEQYADALPFQRLNGIDAEID